MKGDPGSDTQVVCLSTSLDPTLACTPIHATIAVVEHPSGSVTISRFVSASDVQIFELTAYEMDVLLHTYHLRQRRARQHDKRTPGPTSNTLL